MNTPNGVLMDNAKADLKGKWGEPIKVTLLMLIIGLVVQFIPAINWLVSLLINGAISLGMASFFLSFSKGEFYTYEKAFEGFNEWWRATKSYLLVVLYTFLWFLLLIIPGIIAAYAYSQTFYILAEDKNISTNDAIRKSRLIMKGNKWKLFCLGLNFIGWGLLCILTLGIGLIWLIPYYQLTLANFYNDIKGEDPSVPTITDVPLAVPTPEVAPTA